MSGLMKCLRAQSCLLLTRRQQYSLLIPLISSQKLFNYHTTFSHQSTTTTTNNQNVVINSTTTTKAQSNIQSMATKYAEKGDVKECLDVLSMYREFDNSAHASRFIVKTLSSLMRSEHLTGQLYMQLFNFVKIWNLLGYNMEITVALLSYSYLVQEHVTSTKVVNEILKPVYSLYAIEDLMTPVIISHVDKGYHKRALYFYNSTIRRGGSFTNHQYNRIINAFIKKRHLDVVQSLMEDARQREIVFTREHELYTLSAYLMANMIPEAMELLDRLITSENHVLLDLPIYGIMLEALKREFTKHPEYRRYIHRVVTHLKGHDLSHADDRFHWTVLAALGEAGDFKGALRWLKERRDQFDIRSMNMVLLGLSKSKQRYKTHELLESMEEEFGVQPDIISFNIVLGCCNTFDQLQTVISEMKEYGVELDRVSYSIVIKFLCKHNMKKKALFFYEQMKQNRQEADRPTPVTMITLISAFKSEPDAVNSFFSDIVNLNIPIKGTLAKLLALYCKDYQEFVVEAIQQGKVNVVTKQPTEAIQTLKVIWKDSMPEQAYSQIAKKLKDMNIHTASEIPK